MYFSLITLAILCARVGGLSVESDERVDVSEVLSIIDSAGMRIDSVVS